MEQPVEGSPVVRAEEPEDKAVRKSRFNLAKAMWVWAFRQNPSADSVERFC